jgi:uncharacterized protein with von Willebrand factor type A (vWA) domain
MSNKYIEELVTEMLFDFNDLALGHTYKEIGYDTKKEFFQEMSRKVNELMSRLNKEGVCHV